MHTWDFDYVFDFHVFTRPINIVRPHSESVLNTWRQHGHRCLRLTRSGRPRPGGVTTFLFIYDE